MVVAYINMFSIINLKMWVPLLVALAITPEVQSIRTPSPTSSGTIVYESGEFFRVVVPLGIMFFVIGGLVGFREYKRRNKKEEAPISNVVIKEMPRAERVNRGRGNNSFFD